MNESKINKFDDNLANHKEFIESIMQKHNIQINNASSTPVPFFHNFNKILNEDFTHFEKVNKIVEKTLKKVEKRNKIPDFEEKTIQLSDKEKKLLNKLKFENQKRELEKEKDFKIETVSKIENSNNYHPEIIIPFESKKSNKEFNDSKLNKIIKNGHTLEKSESSFPDLILKNSEHQNLENKFEELKKPKKEMNKESLLKKHIKKFMDFYKKDKIQINSPKKIAKKSKSPQIENNNSKMTEKSLLCRSISPILQQNKSLKLHFSITPEIDKNKNTTFNLSEITEIDLNYTVNEEFDEKIPTKITKNKIHNLQTILISKKLSNIEKKQNLNYRKIWIELKEIESILF